MADLNQLLVPDWMRNMPAPAPPTHHVEKPSQDNAGHRDKSSEEVSEDKVTVQMEAGCEDSVARETREEAVAVEKPKAKKVEQLPANSDDEDQTPFSMVSYSKWMSKEKAKAAPAVAREEEQEKVRAERVLVIKGKPPMKILKETTPTLASKETAEPDSIGDPGKAQPLAPTASKTKSNKKGRRSTLSEPVEDTYTRPTSKVAAKFSHYARAAAGGEDLSPTNTAATLTHLKTEQSAIIRKRRTKATAVPAPLQRVLDQKLREDERHRQEANEPRAAAHHDLEPRPNAKALALAPITPTRLQLAFKAMHKRQIRPAVNLVAPAKVRPYLPKNAEQDKELLWKVVKWAVVVFVVFLVYELHFA